MKKIICLVLAVLMLCPVFAACDKEENTGAVLLSFSQAQSVEEMKNYDGKQVSIIGYMSTLSPISGDFMYLMNLPYQSCPFCVPNTTNLSNTMAVYAKDEFKFTDRAIQVTGKLKFGDYTDEFGYNYSYRIVDAVYEVVDTSSMSEQLKLWQQLASTDIMTDVYSMFEYLNFLCFWPTYTAQFDGGSDYLYPPDAIYFVETDGARYNYGFKSGYFENLISTVKDVDENSFSDLINILEDAKKLSEDAYSALKNGNYILTAEYSGAFNDGRDQYKIVNNTVYENEMERIYTAFSQWLLSWEI